MDVCVDGWKLGMLSMEATCPSSMYIVMLGGDVDLLYPADRARVCIHVHYAVYTDPLPG